MPFAQDVLTTVNRRLIELDVSNKHLSLDELKARFGRQAISDAVSHFEIEIDGTPCALTVTALDEQQVEDYGPVRAVSEEVGRLQTSGRFVAYHQVIVAPRGTVLLDLVGPERTASQMPLDQSAERFLEDLLDHDTVQPLLRHDR